MGDEAESEEDGPPPDRAVDCWTLFSSQPSGLQYEPQDAVGVQVVLERLEERRDEEERVRKGCYFLVGLRPGGKQRAGRFVAEAPDGTTAPEVTYQVRPGV